MMPYTRESIAEKIRKIKGKSTRHEVTGMLYTSKKELRRKYAAINLYALFVSDESTFAIRTHVFSTKKSPRNPIEWHEWLRKHYHHIMPNILDGMELRSMKQWRVYRIIGWRPK